MRYLNYVPFGERHWEYIFYYKTTEKATLYCKPACFQWIQNLGFLNRLDEVNWMQIMLTDIISEEVPVDYEPKTFVEKIYDFPVTDEDVPYLVSIYNFFEDFELKRFNSEIDRFDYCIKTIYPKVPNWMMKKIVRFAFEGYKNHPDRMRVFLSEKVHSFLITCEKEGTMNE